MLTYQQAIKQADQLILENNDFSEARYFLNELCENHNIDLYSVINNPMDLKIQELFDEGVKRLMNSEPVSHILGYSWFYGRKFIVNEDVLIPRNETEQLVLNTILEIEDYFGTFDLELLDLATGSGAIGISLKKEEPELSVTISDISKDALLIAKKNADKLEANLDIVQGDMLQPFENDNFDVIICNPPYINDDELIQKSVEAYEPHIALFGGKDGLKFYREVLNDSKDIINSPGMLGFEIGYDQRERMSALVEEIYPGKKYKILKDYAGLDRMLFVYV